LIPTAFVLPRRCTGTMDDSERAQIVAKVGEPWHHIDWAARKRRVAELRAAGFSTGQIAQYLDVSRDTVYYWLKDRDIRRARKLQEREPRPELADLPSWWGTIPRP